VDGCSRAAVSIIERHRDESFFLYIAYRAPHVPLDAPMKYLDRFPGQMPERRRQALAMLSAVDDGVGLITSTLTKHNLTEKTLIFYIGDNGAPLKIHKLDAPGGGPGWDGSLNDPLNGEKGMLAEGGMHVPFVISWPGQIPGRQTFDHPVSALDVAATAAQIAHLETKPEDLDGVNLIPHLTGVVNTPPHEILTWRWLGQSAIREGKWKLLRGGEREYLYDLAADIEEKHNLAAKHPEIVAGLRAKLTAWADKLDPPGLDDAELSKAASDYFDFYLDGKPPTRTRVQPTDAPASIPRQGVPTSDSVKLPWLVRNGNIRQSTDGWALVPNGKGTKQSPFLTRNGLNLAGPVSVKLIVKAANKALINVSWRTSGDKTFTADKRIDLTVDGMAEWKTLESTLPDDSAIVHIRIQMPDGLTIRSLELTPRHGATVTLER
jgi:uncharacterized sulfatase